MQLGDDQTLEVMKPLLEVHPQELKFTFEVKKQSSCAVHLTNPSDQYVAFKVKTTSPKKYCVRPNTGIVKPKSTCEFTVTMQAQRSAPLDMQCKDKFLIQSTVAPFGTSEEDIIPGLFAKESGKYIEESKLRVILASPSLSPELSPVNGVTKKEQSYVISAQNEKLQSGVENLPPPQPDAKIIVAEEELLSAQVEESSNSPSKSWDDVESKTQESIHSPSSSGKLTSHKDVEGRNMRSSKDIEELNSKALVLESKLIEAQFTIKRLKEENTTILQEKERLKQELGRIKRKGGPRQVQRGFPPLFVCMVALISLAVGFFLRSG